MISGDSKHDSRKILPKIKWKTKDDESYTSIETKDKYYKPLKPNLKKKSSNYRLIKILKIKPRYSKVAER